MSFVARNHPQQVDARGADDATDDRRTPRDLFDARHALHRFTIDAAASPENAMLTRFWTRADDALAQDWRGERVWCNPPYSDLRPWVEKAAKGGAAIVDMLLPANRCEQAWWQDVIEPTRDTPGGPRALFLRGRLRFERPGWTKPTRGDRPPFGLVLVTWTHA